MVRGSSTRQRAGAGQRRGKLYGRARVYGHIWSTATWVIAILMFFPVFWMLLTAFKPEGAAYTDPPRLLFHPTLSEFSQVFSGGIMKPFEHSVFVTLTSTAAVLLFSFPAAYALSIRPVKRWKDTMFFFLTVKMLPVASGIIPIYIVARNVHLLDNDWTLVLLYVPMNLPIAVWMIRSFLLEVPREVLDAARVDGAGVVTELSRVIFPIIVPGLVATGLICVIFSWNEFFYAVNLTATRAGTMPVFLIGFILSEGLYWAKLAAAACLCSVPVILAGWLAQKHLVRGLALGAVK